MGKLAWIRNTEQSVEMELPNDVSVSLQIDYEERAEQWVYNCHIHGGGFYVSINELADNKESAKAAAEQWLTDHQALIDKLTAPKEDK